MPAHPVPTGTVTSSSTFLLAIDGKLAAAAVAAAAAAA
jgi:hypothetical protein